MVVDDWGLCLLHAVGADGIEPMHDLLNATFKHPRGFARQDISSGDNWEGDLERLVMDNLVESFSERAKEGHD